MVFLSSLGKRLYEIWYGAEEKKLMYRFQHSIAKELGKIAEKFWEKIPPEEKERIIFKNTYAQETYPEYTLFGRLLIPHTGHLIVLEYRPRTTIELMELAEKAEKKEKTKIVIKLEEKAKELIHGLYKSGYHKKFFEYVDGGKMSLEEALMRIGYGERIYRLIKAGVEYLREKATEYKKPTLEKTEATKISTIGKFGLLVALFAILFSSVLFSIQATGLVAMPSMTINPVVWLFVLLIILLIILFTP